MKLSVMKCFVSSHMVFANICIFPYLFELRNRIKLISSRLPYFCKSIVLVLWYAIFHRPGVIFIRVGGFH